MKLRPYVVRQGDYLLKLASQLGFDADEVWGLAENKPLKDSGREPNLLKDGDMLYVPDDPPQSHALVVGATNIFTSDSARVKVSVRFMAYGEALANEPYVVDGDVPAGTLDGDGTFEAELATSVDCLVVRFPKRYEAYTVNVGHLDPVCERSGLVQRLAHLGYLPIAPTAPIEDTALENALRALQRDAQIEETGEGDEATSQELVKRHGS
jgi:hypothetical protein